MRIYWGLVLIKEPACRRQRRASSGREGSGGSCRETGRNGEGIKDRMKRMTKDKEDEVNGYTAADVN